MALIDAIKKLHTSMIDTREGYEKARVEAEDPAVKTLFDEMVALRYKHHEQLHRVLTAMGEQSAVTGVTRDSLSSFSSGEESIVKEYDDALGEDDIRTETTELLIRQRSALVEKVRQIKALAGS